ncbi:MAG: HipA N-terminal domain-containing protein [Akkermansia sp.]|nr:HipA N-terminal domain-containing protein [Akkermansia sp.]
MSARKAIIYVKGAPAAVLSKHPQPGPQRYVLQYLPEYLKSAPCHPVCYHMPPRPEAYYSEYLFPFFESLLPEGENLAYLCRALKLDEHDRFSQLLCLAGNDTIGDVTVRRIDEE